MKDFICIDLKTSLDDNEINNYVRCFFSDFAWRSGNSDMQGRYISGVNIDGVHIQLWLGDRPVAMSISFRDLPTNNPDRESKKMGIVNRVRGTLIPTLGEMVSFEA